VDLGSIGEALLDEEPPGILHAATAVTERKQRIVLHAIPNCADRRYSGALLEVLTKKKMGHFVAAMPGMKLGAGWGLRMVAVHGCGWKVHAGASVPPVVTGSLWTVRGRNKVWCWVPVAGHARCCFERACQSPD
jgi:hypothetical protein